LARPDFFGPVRGFVFFRRKRPYRAARRKKIAQDVYDRNPHDDVESGWKYQKNDRYNNDRPQKDFRVGITQKMQQLTYRKRDDADDIYFVSLVYYKKTIREQREKNRGAHKIRVVFI